jgi:peptidoglycan/LPS O-acetylase OafA/YrhL
MFRTLRKLDRPHRYSPEIDGLRGVAILIVLGQHLSGRFVPFGFLGVDVFFVISGYVIYNSYFSTSSIRLSSFYLRRFARLTPVVLVCLSLYVWIPSLRNQVSNDELLFSFFYIKNFQDFDWPLGPYWSLSAEEQFYLVAGLIYACNRKYRFTRKIVLGCCFLLCIISLSGVIFGFASGNFNSSAFFNLGIYRPSEIIFGVILASECRRKSLSLKRILGLLTSRTYVAILCVIIFSFRVPTAAALVTVSLIAISVFSPVRYPILIALLRSQVLVQIGVLSYSIYIWHPVVLVITSQLPNTFFTLFVRLILIYLCALLSYRTIEMPCQRLLLSLFKHY